jgi:hypothetical protein
MLCTIAVEKFVEKPSRDAREGRVLAETNDLPIKQAYIVILLESRDMRQIQLRWLVNGR